MRNLLAFLKRFQIFLVFVILQVISIVSFSSQSEFARLQMLTTTSVANASLLSIRNSVSKHFYLETNNKKLAFKNKYLLEQLKSAHYQIDRGNVKIDDTLYKQQFQYVPGTVIQNTYDKRDNYLTIDIGKKQGLKRGMGVFSSTGLVGIVHFAGTNYALVKSIISQNINIDVMLKKSGAFGFLKWDAMNPTIVQITGINSDIKIKKFEKVITRGASGIFPKGIAVGTVIKKEKQDGGKPLWDIQVRTSEDFRTIQHVYVIKNLKQAEIKAVNAQIPKETTQE